MIDWIIVGLLVAIAFALYDISKGLMLFRIHFDGNSITNREQRQLIDTIERMEGKLAEISFNTGRLHGALDEIRINTWDPSSVDETATDF